MLDHVKNLGYLFVIVLLFQCASPGLCDSGTGSPSVHRFSFPSDISSKVALLQAKLSLSTFLPSTPSQSNSSLSSSSSWIYGTNRAYVAELSRYWKSDYLPKWEERKAKMESIPSFYTSVKMENSSSVFDGQSFLLHFTYYRSSQPHALPLLLLNGWPSTFLEYAKIGPILSRTSSSASSSSSSLSSAQLPFHVIAPSTPGFGFSPSAPESGIEGFGTKHMAHLSLRLMLQLNFSHFVVHGSDWGSIVASHLGYLYPQHVLGVHVVFLPLPPPFTRSISGFFTSLFSYVFPSYFLSAIESVRHTNMYSVLVEESGYLHLQATKPDSIAQALIDSPIGLLTYFLDKWYTWTDRSSASVNDMSGGLETVWSKDDLLDMIMIYILSDSVPSSLRYYFHNFHGGLGEVSNIFVPVPTAVAVFPFEPAVSPKSWAEYYYNIVRWEIQSKGGHFPAQEVPKVLADDLEEFVRKWIRLPGMDKSVGETMETLQMHKTNDL